MNTERDTVLDLEGFLPRRTKAISMQLDGDCGRSPPKTSGSREEGWRSELCWVGFLVLRRTLRFKCTLQKSCRIQSGDWQQPWEEAEGREGVLGRRLPHGLQSVVVLGHHK